MGRQGEGGVTAAVTSVTFVTWNSLQSWVQPALTSMMAAPAQPRDKTGGCFLGVLSRPSEPRAEEKVAAVGLAGVAGARPLEALEEVGL